MSKRRVPMARTLLSTCRHEAAHAVVCKQLGGRVLYCQVKGPGKGETSQDMRRALGPLSFAIMAMAGTVAENLWHKIPPGIVSAGDGAVLDAMGLTPVDKRELYYVTRRVLLRHKKDIWALARRLLSGKRVRP